jgi:6-phosphogluconate dehydrogenase
MTLDAAIVGMGRMGAGVSLRLASGGFQVIGYDSAAKGIEHPRFRTAPDLLSLLPAPVVWVLVPPGASTRSVLSQLAEVVQPGSIVIDAGNSHYRDSQQYASLFRARDVLFVDAGISGGIHGAERGYCLMLGGAREAVARLAGQLDALGGWQHVGASGAGHYVKMVHNGIEYGVMQALAEGFGLLKKNPAFNFDVGAIARLWQEGSILQSFLLEVCQDSFEDVPTAAPVVADNGSGRWMLADAIEHGAPVPVLAAALMQRLRSQDVSSYSDRLLAVLRNRFGGHSLTREA